MSADIANQKLLHLAGKIENFLVSPQGKEVLGHLKKKGKVFTLQSNSQKDIFVSYLMTGNGLVEISISSQVTECRDIKTLSAYELLQSIQQFPEPPPLEEIVNKCLGSIPHM